MKSLHLGILTLRLRTIWFQTMSHQYEFQRLHARPGLPYQRNSGNFNSSESYADRFSFGISLFIGYYYTIESTTIRNVQNDYSRPRINIQYLPEGIHTNFMLSLNLKQGRIQTPSYLQLSFVGQKYFGNDRFAVLAKQLESNSIINY